MKSKPIVKVRQKPFLYYKKSEEIEVYRRKPVKQKLQWHEEQMEFFHKAMSDKAKRIRERLRER